MDTVKNAIIESTFLGIEHGTLTATVHVAYDGHAQGFGGYNLQGWTGPESQLSAANVFICGVLRAVGASSWEALKGKYVRIKHGEASEAGPIIAIGHITEDVWFDAVAEMGN
jgi:hypothetical protein